MERITVTTDVKLALNDILLENMSMENIVDEYGMEVAEEVGSLMSEAYDYLINNVIE